MSSHDIDRLNSELSNAHVRLEVKAVYLKDFSKEDKFTDFVRYEEEVGEQEVEEERSRYKPRTLIIRAFAVTVGSTKTTRTRAE